MTYSTTNTKREISSFSKNNSHRLPNPPMPVPCTVSQPLT